MVNCQKQGWKQVAYIQSNQDYCSQNDGQIAAHFFTAEGILGFFDQKQVINIKIHAKKDHCDT